MIYGAQANYHSQGCSSCLPARARVTARTCVPRFSDPPGPACAHKKGIRSRPVKIFYGGCRAFIRRLLANSGTGADGSRAQILFRDVPQEYEVSPHIWLRPRRCSLRKRVPQLCPRDGNCFLSAFVEDLADQRNVNLFLSDVCVVRGTLSRTALRIDLRNYGDA